MHFDLTAANVTTLMVFALGVWAMFVASNQKSDANLPLIFYATLMGFNRWFELGIDMSIILVAIALAMLIRFEFLNKAFIKWITYTEMAVMAVLLWGCLVAMLGPGLALRI